MGDDLDWWLFETVVIELSRLWKLWSVVSCFKSVLVTRRFVNLPFAIFPSWYHINKTSQLVMFLVSLPFEANHLCLLCKHLFLISLVFYYVYWLPSTCKVGHLSLFWRCSSTGRLNLNKENMISQNIIW